MPSGLATRTVPTYSEHAERRTRYQIPNDVECQEFILGIERNMAFPLITFLSFIVRRFGADRGGHVHIVPAKEHIRFELEQILMGENARHDLALSLSLSCQCTTCGAGSVCNKSEYTKECRCYREHCSHVQLGCGC